MIAEVRPQPATQSRSSPPKNKSAALDVLVALVIVVFVLAIFSRTVIDGQPLSRIFTLADWDSAFSKYSSGTSHPMDPSLIQLMVPYYFVVAKLWHSGQLPLWNPFNGCGVPLLADIQSSALSPFNLLLALSPTMYTYNLGLVLKVAVAAATMFGLARVLGLTRCASAFASLTYALSPFCLTSLELIPRGYCWHPLVFLCFVRAAYRPGARRSLLAGAACALLIVSEHPEVSFFCIAASSLLMVMMVLCNPPAKESAAETDREELTGNAGCGALIALAGRLRRSMKILAIAGVSAFCLAAPLLLPFGEFLLNADCYKFHSIGGYSIPWQAFICNLFNPGKGVVSSYLGCVTAILLPVAFTVARPAIRQILALLLIGFLVICRLPPVSLALVYPPLSFLHCMYALPDFLLLAALAAAFGFDKLLGDKQSKLSPAWWIAAFAAVVVALLPWCLHHGMFAFDPALQHLSVNTNAWRRDCAIAGAFVCLAAAYRLLRTLPAFPVAAACVVLAFASEGALIKLALPVQAKFDYYWVQPLEFLRDSGERMLTTGHHVLRPNTSSVYGVSDIRVHNPLFPKRYLSFMRACGASVDAFNQAFEHTLSPLVNVAAVRYVLSMLPVRAERGSPCTYSSVSALGVDGISFGPDIRLASALISHQPECADACGRLEFDVRCSDPRRYSYSLVWLDDNENLVWFGDQIYLDNKSRKHALATMKPARIVQEFAAPISLAIRPGSQLRLAVQVFDWQQVAFLKPSVRRAHHHQNLAILGDFQAPNHAQRSAAELAAGAQLQLQFETPNRIRVYKNKAAVSRAQIVHETVLVGSEAEALKAMQSPDFDPLRQAVLEASAGSRANSIMPVNGKKHGYRDQATIEHSGTNEVLVRVRLTRPGFLVLADTYYPGWTARMDGQNVPILRANYLFRAVYVPSGSHIVEFKYLPLSFWIGVVLSGVCIAIGLLVLALTVRRSGPHGTRTGRALARNN